MSFYKTSTGQPITGDPEKAYGSGFSLIPPDTFAVASIKSFLAVEDQYGQRYQIRWKIAEGHYKGRELSQNLYAFDQDKNRSDRAKEMIVLVFKLCNHKPTHVKAPSNEDLAPLVGKLCTIKIDAYKGKDGQDRNLVSEVHAQYYEAPKQDNFSDYAAHSLPKAEHVEIPDNFDQEIPF